jgi:hypothetical protein
MSTTQIATEPVARSARLRAAETSLRPLLILLLGPLTALIGVVWAIVQPYRITLLDPSGQGFWWLFAEAPLFVVLVGVLFHLFVARPLLEDLREES